MDEMARQFELTFREDFDIIRAQHRNQCAFGHPAEVHVHIDAAPNRARRVIARLST
jgi:vanillate O-demethylase monooxygenase subunit